MTEPELHLMRIRAAEGRATSQDVLALLAEVERLGRDLADAHGLIQGLKDVIYNRVPAGAPGRRSVSGKANLVT